MTYNENKELFIEAYNSNIWKINDYNYKFYSGIGSHKTDITNKYITYINKFISDYNIHTLLDFGCGDFNIGKQYKVNMYYGIDIIDNLIQYNKEKYEDDNHKFLLNKDNEFNNIEFVDLIIVKEVFQHLTNDLIKNIIDKLLLKCKYLLIIDSNIHNAKYINKDCNDHNKLLKSKALSINSNHIFTKDPFNYNCKVIYKINKLMNNEYWFIWLFDNT